MRTIHFAIMASMSLMIGSAGASASAPGAAAAVKQARRAPATLLRPLSDRDQQAARGSGCQLSFNTRRSTLVYVIGNEFMIRTGAGRRVCRISDAQFSALSDGGVQSCGGLRVAIRQTGRSVGNQASDTASAPATLTVTGRGRPWTVRGHWGTAC